MPTPNQQEEEPVAADVANQEEVVEPVPPPNQEEEDPAVADAANQEEVVVPVDGPYQDLEESDGSLEVSNIFSCVPFHLFHFVWFASVIIICTHCCCLV